MTTVPLSGTNIRFLSGIPFNSDYKHTRWFDTLTDQTSYFSNKPIVHSMSESIFRRIEGNTFIAVNKSIDELWNTNYLMFQNATYNNKWFYAFVTKLEYIQQKTTHVHFQIDVFQTWKFEMNFKPSYVVREHCPLWNTDGSPIINTVDEGLNYGTEYDTVQVSNYVPNGGYKWLVIISKTPFHDNADNKAKPTLIGTPQPLSVYLIPFKDDNTIPAVNILGGFGSSANISKPTDVLTNIYSNDQAVNNVVSIFVTDYTGIECSYSNDVFTFPDNGNLLSCVQVSNAGANAFNLLYVEKIKEFKPLTTSLGSKYSGYKTVKESKLLMYPYTETILDDFKGNRVTLKNEYIEGNDLNITTKGSLGVSNKTSYGVQEYNFHSGTLQDMVSDEFALINNEPNDVPIITDMLAAYLQGNRNSIHNQKVGAVWNGVMGGVSSVMSGVSSGNPLGVASGIVGATQGAGNTILQIQGLQAKQADISNTPPSMVKMGSNTSYTVGNKYDGLYVIKKQIKDEYIRKLEHFFNMYGYKLNEVKTPNFHTRQYWNFVQTVSCIITGNINNDDLQVLKNIFDGGITLWHTDDIGNYSLENEVI